MVYKLITIRNSVRDYCVREHHSSFSQRGGLRESGERIVTITLYYSKRSPVNLYTTTQIKYLVEWQLLFYT